MSEIHILHAPTSAEPFIVLYKPRGLPSAPLKKSENENALFKAAELFPEVFNVCGKNEVEFGLLHRLDTATEGLLLIATSQLMYENLLDAQKDGLFLKEYYAKCFKTNSITDLNGFPSFPIDLSNNEKIFPVTPYTIESYFRPYGVGSRQVRPVTLNSGTAALKKSGKKLYKTTILSVEDADDGFYFVKASLKNGFRHQVRAHLAWAGIPICGDLIYGGRGEKFCFSATKIEFPHFTDEGKYSFSIKPDFLQ